MKAIADLTGKVAVVTGGSRGLGRAMSFGFAEHGATVIIASRKADSCQATAEEITAATGREVVGLGCHVGDWAQCDRLVGQAYDCFGRVDFSALVGPRMMPAGKGSIINVSSVAAVVPTPLEVPYAAAKAGLNNLAGDASSYTTGAILKVDGGMAHSSS